MIAASVNAASIDLSQRIARPRMSKNRKNKFRNRYQPMTQIGRTLGMSARKLGAKLKEVGLREADGKPSAQALEQGLAVPTPMKDGTPHFMWDKTQLLQALADHGIRPNRQAADDLRLRETVGNILRLIESEGFERGGGIEYKLTIEALFSECLPRLPLPKGICRVRGAICNARAKAESKDYALLLVSYRCAESKELDDATARYIIERESDWRVLEELSTHNTLSEWTKATASRKFREMAPEQIVGPHQLR